MTYAGLCIFISHIFFSYSVASFLNITINLWYIIVIGRGCTYCKTSCSSRTQYNITHRTSLNIIIHLWLMFLPPSWPLYPHFRPRSSIVLYPRGLRTDSTHLVIQSSTGPCNEGRNALTCFSAYRFHQGLLIFRLHEHCGQVASIQFVVGALQTAPFSRCAGGAL